MTRRLERLEFRAVGTTCAAAVTIGGPGDLRRAAKRALSAAKAEVAACETGTLALRSQPATSAG